MATDVLTLLGIRTKFVDLFGHYELVVDAAGSDYTDAGADYHIRAGQRMLDQMQDNPTSMNVLQKDTLVGDHKLVFSNNRTVEDVWITNGSAATGEGRTKLIKQSYAWIKREYSKPVASITKARPLYYTKGTINLAPEQIALTAGSYTSEFTYDFEDISFGQDNYDKTGIIFFPPADKVYTIIVKGKFFSNPLIADGDKSYWSINYPDVLVLSAMWSLERYFRNTQGMNDMLTAIKLQLNGLDKDLVSEDIAEIDFVQSHMEGRS